MKMAMVLKPFGSIEREKKALQGMASVIGAFPGKNALSETEILNMIDNADILIADVDIIVTEKILKHAKNLRAVICTSIGVDYVDIPAATDCGIIVANNPDFCIVAVAEYTIGLILSLTRYIPQAIDAVKEGSWQIRSKLRGMELFGKTLGIIGLGKIGREVALRARSFGMNILGFSPNAGPLAAAAVGAKFVTLEELLRESDIVTLHTSLRKETKKLLSYKEFELFKEGSYLINTGRGGLIDEQALVDALKSNRISGAALDVLTIEPPDKDNPLLNMDNVIVTPHIAWNTNDAENKAQEILIKQTRLVLEGKEPPFTLNPQVLPRWKERITLMDNKGR